VTYWYWLTDSDPDPTLDPDPDIFVSDLQHNNEIFFLSFLLFTFWSYSTFASFFKDKKS